MLLKLYPEPKYSGTMMVSFEDCDQATETAIEVLKSESFHFLLNTWTGPLHCAPQSIWVRIIGAVVINYLLETLRFLQQYRLIIYGAVLFLVILFMPSGLMGLIQLIKEKLTEYKKKPQVKGGESSAS